MTLHKCLLPKVLTVLIAMSLVPLSARGQEPPRQGRAVFLVPLYAYSYPATSNVPAIMDFTAIAGGSVQAVGLRSDGSLVSWGNDYFGEVSGTPTGNDFVDVAAGLHWSV